MTLVQVPLEQLRSDLLTKVVKTVIPANLLDDKTVYHLQPSGMFAIGGPQGELVKLEISIRPGHKS